MLEIHKINEIEIIKRLETEINLEYNKNNIFLGVYIDGEVKEYLCYRQSDDSFTVLYVSDNTKDFQLIFGLVKTLVFLADMAMAEYVVLPLFYDRIAKAVGFDKTPDNYILKISEYHEKCGKCC